MITPVLARRLLLLNAIVAASQRWSAVSAAVAAAEDRAAARVAVAELLGVEAIGARAVLDLRWEQLHQGAGRAFRDERDATAAESATPTCATRTAADVP